MTNNSKTITKTISVYITYSRNDIHFADQLVGALNSHDFDVTIDRHGLTGDEDSRRHIRDLISHADTVVFVLSPNSAASKMCDWELNEATRLGKRIIPVVCAPLADATTPPQLADLQFIFFYDEQHFPGSGFGSGQARLVSQLNNDREWVREHTNILLRATAWVTEGRPTNRLLTGRDVESAKTWVAERPKHARALTELHLEYIAASEKWDNEQKSAAWQRLEERERTLRQAEAALKAAAGAKTRTDHQRRSGGMVFISYRRDDSRDSAGRLYDRLNDGSLRGKLFIDVDTIQKGRDFNEVLAEHLSQCQVMLVIVGPNWLNARDGDGNRRLDNADDYVAREITTALKRNISVIPLLVNGAAMPTTSELPLDLRSLADRQNYSITHETFGRDVEDLKRHITMELGISKQWHKTTFVITTFLILIFVAAYASITPLKNWLPAWLATVF